MRTQHNGRSFFYIFSATSPVELPLAVTIESSSFDTINLTDKSSAQYKNLTDTITTDVSTNCKINCTHVLLYR